MNKNYRPDYTYGDFGNEFKAEFFDPNQWAQIINNSGAKYVVLTAKHHEGFENKVFIQSKMSCFSIYKLQAFAYGHPRHPGIGIQWILVKNSLTYKH